MKQFSFIILAFFSFGINNNLLKGQTICVGQQVTLIESFNQCDYNPWILCFEENFDGNSLDLSKWEPVTGVPRDFNFNRQKAWHLPENIEVSNGTLKIISEKLTTPYVGTWVVDWSTNPPTTKTATFDYTTGELWTKQKFSYGKYEARIKIPKGKGFFPAYWLFGGNPRWNEIDIFEFWSANGSSYNPSNLSKIHHMTTHYDYQNNGNSNSCGTQYTGVDFSQDFHIFTLIWERNKIEWYVDGVLKRTDHRYYTTLGQTVGCEIQSYPTVYIRNEIYPRDPMNIVLNVAIESGNANSGAGYVAPDHTTPFPSHMEVDWVRYYKRAPCNNNVVITNSSQFPLDNNVYNVMIGKNVEINCNFNIPSGKQLDIIAKNSITLKPGFHAEAGSVFSAKIDPSICGKGSMTMSEDFDIDDLNENDYLIYENLSFENENTILSIIEENRQNVNVFPNPNKGCFTVEFDAHSEYRKYSLKIMTAQGQVIYAMDNIFHSSTNIDLSKHPSGIYILSLNNIETLRTLFYKIVVF